MADYHYGFKQVDQLGSSLVTDQLESSLYSWLEWGLLGIGAFTNVTLAAETPHGSLAPAKLRPVGDPRFPATAGNTYLFEGVRQDWVWQTGVPYDTSPTSISGIYVDGTFVSSASTGVYEHKILYPEGRVLFTNPVATGTEVKVEHAYRQVHVRRSDEPWFQEVMFRSFRADEDFQKTPGSGGAWDVLSQNRVQLPTYVLEPVNRVRMTPLEIGSSARKHQQDFLFHCLAETPWDCRKLHDILMEQYDKRIPSFDRNAITFPLDYQGTPVDGFLTYPDLVQGSPWRQIRVMDITSTPQEDIGKKFYWATVRYTLEVDAP